MSCGMSLCPYPGIHAGSIDLGANFCSARPHRKGTTSSSVPCMIKTLEDTFAIFSWFTKMSMGLNLCGNQPVCRVPCWLRRAVRNRHRHAVEQASRRWREGHDWAVGGDARRHLISTQAATRARTRSPARTGWRCRSGFVVVTPSLPRATPDRLKDRYQYCDHK